MSLDQNDWASIYAAIEAAIPSSEIVYGTVTKRDADKRLIWMAEEFEDQPIPLVGFNGHVKVYDDNGTTTSIKRYEIIHEVPKVGETAVVLRQLGSRRLPKCVGVILSRGGFVV